MVFFAPPKRHPRHGHGPSASFSQNTPEKRYGGVRRRCLYKDTQSTSTWSLFLLLLCPRYEETIAWRCLAPPPRKNATWKLHGPPAFSPPQIETGPLDGGPLLRRLYENYQSTASWPFGLLLSSKVRRKYRMGVFGSAGSKISRQVAMVLRPFPLPKYDQIVAWSSSSPPLLPKTTATGLWSSGLLLFQTSSATCHGRAWFRRLYEKTAPMLYGRKSLERVRGSTTACSIIAIRSAVGWSKRCNQEGDERRIPETCSTIHVWSTTALRSVG